jgi:hypothetical protein
VDERAREGGDENLHKWAVMGPSGPVRARARHVRGGGRWRLADLLLYRAAGGLI